MDVAVVTDAAHDRPANEADLEIPCATVSITTSIKHTFYEPDSLHDIAIKSH